MTEKGKSFFVLSALAVLILRCIAVLKYTNPFSGLSTQDVDWFTIAGAAVFVLSLLAALFAAKRDAPAFFSGASRPLKSRSGLSAALFAAAAVAVLLSSLGQLADFGVSVYRLYSSGVSLDTLQFYGFRPLTFWLGLAAGLVGLVASYGLFEGFCAYYRGRTGLFASRGLPFFVIAWYFVRTLHGFLGRSLNPHNTVYLFPLIMSALLAVAFTALSKCLACGPEDSRAGAASFWAALALPLAGLSLPSVIADAQSGFWVTAICCISDALAAAALFFASVSAKKHPESKEV